MTLIDFIIGLSLVNGLSHFVLGTWKANMLSGFGFGHLQNKLYGFLNLVISLALYIYSYGFESIVENGIYAGGLTVVILYMLTGRIWRDLSNKKVQNKNKNQGTTTHI